MADAVAGAASDTPWAALVVDADADDSAHALGVVGNSASIDADTNAGRERFMARANGESGNPRFSQLAVVTL